MSADIGRHRPAASALHGGCMTLLSKETNARWAPIAPPAITLPVIVSSTDLAKRPTPGS
ncbi:MAG: hypothetical protein R2719_04275 [Micropruina sp.]